MTDQDKQTLRSLLFTPHWKVLEQLADEMCREINGRTKVGETEFETVKKAINDEGEQRGIRSVLQRIFDLGNQSTP